MIKRRIIKGQSRIRLPVSVYIVAGFAIILLSLYLSLHISVIPEKIIYMTSVIAMPDGISGMADRIKTHIAEKFFPVPQDFFQSEGNLNDIEEKRQFYDLSVTPPDIIENEAFLRKQFADKKYQTDGTVAEKTYISYQATDSYDGVYVRNVTVDSEIDVQGITENGCALPVDDYSEPVVLIYHTHSTESYIPFDNGTFSSAYPGRNNDKSLNMIRVGEELAAVLRARGIGVIHDTAIYDTVYTGAYDKSRSGITAILEKYPSIVITLDIHRDAIYYDDLTRVKPVAEINGVKAAQMMIIAGAEGGNVEDFASWRTNLSFALSLQHEICEKYENLMKPMYFCNRRYNMDITPYSLLVEVGTDMNTLSEAAYSARLLGDVLAQYIKTNSRGK